MRFVLVAVVLLYAAPALSYRTGAPLEACTTATPNHQQAAPQPSSANPYRIGLGVFDARRGDLTYVPGRTYQGKSIFAAIEVCSVTFTGSYSPRFIYPVTLSAAGNSPTFRGFFIQGRLVADDSPVGAFVDPPSGSGARLSSCNISNVCM